MHAARAAGPAQTDERKKEQPNAQVGNFRGHDPESPHTQHRRRHGSYRIAGKGPEAYLPPPGHHPRGIAHDGGNSHDGNGGLGAEGQTQHWQQDYGRPGAHHPADGPCHNAAKSNERVYHGLSILRAQICVYRGVI